MRKNKSLNQYLKNIYDLYSSNEKLITRYHEIEKEIRDKNDITLYVTILISILALLKNSIDKKIIFIVAFSFLILSLYKFLMFITLSRELKSIENKLNFEKKFKNKTVDTIQLFIFIMLTLATIINLLVAWI
ncbi:hypothetical protein [Fusobacterium perfoetens]|uniref:hypothetical protein n=1 Tax=Fusobacterium perfoetens TaxID=852 RepID=UPI0026EDE3C7|nr:hypothetical protein [Fusobacterium perfoetens]